MTLVIMAAGMGSRYGGLKQIDPITGQGAFILDFSIYDAIAAGFDRVVFVIKEENYALFKETSGIKPSDITWTVDDPNVATVDENGRIYGVNRGKTTVRAQIGDLTATCIVRCKFDAVEDNGVKISHTDVTLKVGETYFLTLTDSRGVKLNVEWTVDVEGYITIDGSKIVGKVSTAGLSKKYVTVTGVYEGVTYTCKIRVKEAT